MATDVLAKETALEDLAKLKREDFDENNYLKSSKRKKFIYGAAITAITKYEALKKLNIDIEGFFVDDEYYKENQTLSGKKIYPKKYVLDNFCDADIIIGFFEFLQYKRIVKENPVILSKCIKNNVIFIEELEKNDIQIYDGKWLYRYILKEMMEYIIKEKGEIKENSEISFLVNYFDDVTIENIKMFAKEYKRINIVTNHIEK